VWFPPPPPPYLVIRGCDSYSKFKRDFGVNDSSSKQDYVLFLRFEVVGNKGGCLETLSNGATAITGMLPEMYSHHQKCIYA